MLNYIVLGQIPGTNLQLGFISLLLLLAIIGGSIFGYRLYKMPLLEPKKSTRKKSRKVAAKTTARRARA
jgi:peptidoglycan/LPS O-acetylase OafA/YrhL